jgi:hypothetical protein
MYAWTCNLFHDHPGKRVVLDTDVASNILCARISPSARSREAVWQGSPCARRSAKAGTCRGDRRNSCLGAVGRPTKRLPTPTPATRADNRRPYYYARPHERDPQDVSAFCDHGCLQGSCPTAPRAISVSLRSADARNRLGRSKYPRADQRSRVLPFELVARIPNDLRRTANCDHDVQRLTSIDRGRR